MHNIGKLKPYRLRSQVMAPPILGYDDYNIVFSNGSINNIRVIQSIFPSIQKDLVNKISSSKIFMYLSKIITPTRATVIKRILNLNTAYFPFTYLGYPILLAEQKVVTSSHFLIRSRRS